MEIKSGFIDTYVFYGIQYMRILKHKNGKEWNHKSQVYINGLVELLVIISAKETIILNTVEKMIDFSPGSLFVCISGVYNETSVSCIPFLE